MDAAVKKYTYHRMAGYIITLVVHIANIIHIKNSIKSVVKPDLEDKNLKTFGELQGRYFTGWTVALQNIHATFGILCELLIIWNLNKKNYQLPIYLRGFRNTLFCGIVFPCTMLVSSVFWSIYNYDRNLILPLFVDKVLSFTANHIIHTFIVPAVLWEVWYQPRIRPRSHYKNIGHLTCHMLVYLSVMMYTYFTKDVWIYPFLKVLYGTIYFPILLLSVAILVFSYYYLHWLIAWFVWGDLKIKSKIK